MASLKFSISSGKLTVTMSSDSFTVDATSGRGAYMNKPDHTNRKSEGPIPIGDYIIYASELSDPNMIGDMARATKGDWGDWRVVLHPTPRPRRWGAPASSSTAALSRARRAASTSGGGMFGDGETTKVLDAISNDSDGIIDLQVVR